MENRVMPGVFMLNRTSSCVVSQVKTETSVTTTSPDWSSFVSLSVWVVYYKYEYVNFDKHWDW